MKILIADDMAINRLPLAAMLRKDGHMVVQAEDGKHAVALFEHEQPDLVIMDVQMPEMDGYQATELIKQRAGSRFVPVIFLTATTAEEELAQCIARGGDDFLTKPCHRTILQSKIATWKRVYDLHAAVTAQKEQLEEHHARLLQDEDVASQIRNNVLNAGCLSRIGIRYRLTPAAILGGDLILAATRPTGALHVMVGDFTGHGLSSSIGALPAADLFYRMTEKGFTLREILVVLNQKLHHTLPVGLFCAACFVEFNPRTGTASVWNGGLPPALVFNAAMGCRVEIPSQHPPLGLLSTAEFGGDMQEIAVASGDRMIIYSDGLTEAGNAAGELFGDARLLACLAKNTAPDGVFDEILAALETFIAGTALQDDLTLVDIPFDLIAAHLRDVETGDTSRCVWPLEWEIQLRLTPDTIRSLDPVPELLHLVSQVPGLDRHKERLFTVLSECLTNAIDHGLLGLDSSLKSSPEGFSCYYHERDRRLAELREGSVTVQLRHVPDHEGGRLMIRVEDSGPGFDLSKTTHDLSGNVTVSGRGIPLIRSLCRQVSFHGKGNCMEALFVW